MVVIPSPSFPLEKIERLGKLKKEMKREERIKLWINKESEAKTHRAWIISRKMLATLNQDRETELIFDAVLKNYDKFSLKHGQEKVEVEIVDSWKGKSHLDFYTGFTENVVILSHQKNKKTGEIEKIHKEIPKENVNRMIWLIKKWKVGESHSCYEVANLMGYDWKNDVWKNRQKIYFPLYYFPLKIMEALELITYTGRGKVTRIK